MRPDEWLQLFEQVVSTAGHSAYNVISSSSHHALKNYKVIGVVSDKLITFDRLYIQSPTEKWKLNVLKLFLQPIHYI